MASHQAGMSQKRKRTAVAQGICGILAITCGIALIPLKPSDEYTSYYISRSLGTIANVGFGIWGGLIIVGTAINGYIYREKKSMISIYAVLSLVSMIMAIVLFWVAIIGLKRSTYIKQHAFCYYHHSGENRCCFQKYLNYCAHNRYGDGTTTPTTNPYLDYNSAECLHIREWTSECLEHVKKTSSANISVYALLLAVSVTEIIVSIFAAVVAFMVVCRRCCRECCNTSDQQVVYYAYPPNAQPGSVPMVVFPSTMPGSTAPQMTGMPPNMMMAPGSYPYPIPVANQEAVIAGMVPGPYPAMTGATQMPDSPPPKYDSFGESK